MIASVRLPCSVLLCQIPSTSPDYRVMGKELLQRANREHFYHGIERGVLCMP